MAKNYRKTRRARNVRKTRRTRNVRKTRRTRRFVGGFQEMPKYTSPLFVNQVRY